MPLRALLGRGPRYSTGIVSADRATNVGFWHLADIAMSRPDVGYANSGYVCFWHLTDVDADAQHVRFQG